MHSSSGETLNGQSRLPRRGGALLGAAAPMLLLTEVYMYLIMSMAASHALLLAYN